MRILGACLALLAPLALPAAAQPAEAARADASPEPTVRYQRAIAPYIASGVGTYPGARQRYLAGLPGKDSFFVIARLTRGPSICALAVVRVAGIDGKKGVISGRIVNAVTGHSGYRQGADIAFPESEVIDWKIGHSDGSEEGNAVGRYIASLGPGVDPSELLVDQRDVDLTGLERSQTVETAIEQTFLRFFGDGDLRVDAAASTPAALKEWPALTRRYRHTPPADLLAEFGAKATALGPARKVTVESMDFQGRKIVLVAAYVVLGKGDSIFEIKQYLHFYYRDAKVLDRVIWGLREGRWIDRGAMPGRPPGPAPTS